MLAEEIDLYYKCKPELLMENRRGEVLWDITVTVGGAVEANCPDLVYMNRAERKRRSKTLSIQLLGEKSQSTNSCL